MKGRYISIRDLEREDWHAYKSGSERRFLCPFCGANKPRDNEHRSLSVNENTGLWKCHRCDESGMLKEYWSKQAHGGHSWASDLSVRAGAFSGDDPRYTCNERVEKLKQLIASLAANFLGSPAESYLIGRGIPTALAQKCGVRYSPTWGGKPSVAVPVIDRNRKLVAAALRAIEGDWKRSIGNKSQGVFMTPGAITAQAVAVVEAPIDAMTLALVGLPAIALLGKSWPCWLPEHLDSKTVFIATDADKSGNDAANKLFSAISGLARCYRFTPPAKDWNEYLMSHGKEAFTEFVVREFSRTGILVPCFERAGDTSNHNTKGGNS